MHLFPALVIRDTPAPEGFQLKVDGVIKARVFPNWDAAYDAAVEAGYDDYEIVEAR